MRAVRIRTPSFRKMWWKCSFTVPSHSDSSRVVLLTAAVGKQPSRWAQHLTRPLSTSLGRSVSNRTLIVRENGTKRPPRSVQLPRRSNSRTYRELIERFAVGWVEAVSWNSPNAPHGNSDQVVDVPLSGLQCPLPDGTAQMLLHLCYSTGRIHVCSRNTCWTNSR